MSNIPRYEKAIRFMLRNETFNYDKKTKAPINEGDGKEYTWIGLTKEDDEKYLPAPYKTLWDVYELSKTDLDEAINIVIEVYHKAYWNPKYDSLVNERLAIRLFDLGVNMGVTTSVKLLQQGLKDLGANIEVDGKFGDATLNAANNYSLVGDNIEKAFHANIDFFMQIQGKIAEIASDIATLNMAELSLDLKDLAKLYEQVYGKIVDNDVLNGLVTEAKERYEAIARKPNFTRFLKGWMNRLERDEYAN